MQKQRSYKPVVQMPVTGQRRAMLNRIRKRAERAGFEIGDVRPIRLRLYAKLVNNRNSYEFRMDRETSMHDMEIRIEKSDAVFIDKMGLAIHKVLVVDDVEIPANSPLFFHPDPNYFTEANEARDLESLYNSLISIKESTDVRLENFDTGILRNVPEQQYQDAAAAIAGAAQAVPAKWPNYGPKVMYDLETNFGLYGNRRNEITLRIGSGSTAAIAGAATHNNYGVLLFDGFQIVDGAESLTKAQAFHLFNDV